MRICKDAVPCFAWKEVFGSSWNNSNQIETLQVNKKNSDLTLKFDGKEIQWEAGESLLQRLELEGIVKQVFPLHGILS